MHTICDTLRPPNNQTESYPAWRARLLQEMVPTHTAPGADFEWEQIAHVPAGTPGASSICGDTWYAAQTSTGQTIYKQRDAAGDMVYAPLDLVQGWLAADYKAMAARLGASQAAQAKLERISLYHEYPQLYTNHLKPFEDQLPRYVELARQADWLISGAARDAEYRAGCIRAAEQFEIPYVVLRHLAWGDEDSVSRYLHSGHDIRALYTHPENGRIYVLLLNGRWYDGEEMIERIKRARSEWASQDQSTRDVSGIAD